MKVEVPGLGASDGQPFKPIPPGEYEVQVTEVTPDTSQAGNPILRIQLEVVEPEEYAGRHIIVSYLTDGGNEISTAQLKQLITAADVELDGDSFDTQDLMGARVKAIVRIRKGANDQDINDVRQWLPV